MDNLVDLLDIFLGYLIRVRVVLLQLRCLLRDLLLVFLYSTQ